MAKKKNYYAIVSGRFRGIFDDWEYCRCLTHYRSNNFVKGFKKFEEAQIFLYEETGIWVDKDEINQEFHPLKIKKY